VSRQFVKSFHTDYITMSAGAASGIDGGPVTLALLWKADSVTDAGLITGRNGSAANVVDVNPFSGDGLNYFAAGGFTSTSAWTSGVWYLSAWTKANGSAAVRSHTYNYTTTTWIHANHGSVSDSVNGPVVDWRIGMIAGSDRLDGKIAAAGVWGSVLADLALEGMTATLASWLAQSPLALWGLNQGSVATNVVDLTGGGADQIDISGTNVSADEPAPWSYSLGPGGPAPGRWGMVHI
jgi:hypothetical protein